MKHRITVLVAGIMATLCMSGVAADAAPAPAQASTTELGTVMVTGEPTQRSLCIFDPVGANGIIAQKFQDYIITARSAGIEFRLKTYSDEGVVAKDLRSGRCDAAAMTGIRVKQFVDFSGSLDMVGGLQTYAQEKTAIQVMASDKAASLMRQGDYEVAGVLPGGKVYLFSREKKYLDSLQAAQGKKVAVIGYDKQASVVADAAGASPVAATIASFGPMFNNHSVDMAYAPAIVYQPFELYKGLGKSGGVADFVLGMLSLQMVVHRDRFPESFLAQSRRWALEHGWSEIMPMIQQADASIPAHYWVHIDNQREVKYRTMLRQIRQRLWDNGWYNHRMQHLLKKIRCADDQGLAECSLGTEGGAVN